MIKAGVPRYLFVSREIDVARRRRLIRMLSSTHALMRKYCIEVGRAAVSLAAIDEGTAGARRSDAIRGVALKTWSWALENWESGLPTNDEILDRVLQEASKSSPS